MPLPKMKTEPEPNVPQEGGETEKTGQASQAHTTPSPPTPGLIPPKLKAGAIVAMGEALKAERKVWSKDAQDFVAEPDHATRLRAAELITAYAEGRPIERKFELRGNVETFEDRKAVMLESPEGIKTLRAVGAISEHEASAALRKLIPTSQD